jgi:hypothetical protein
LLDGVIDVRLRIEALDVDAMEWEASPAPGVSFKRLSANEETGARTSLTRLNPIPEYKVPHTAHYHDGYEEILSVSGRFSFDSRLWMVEGAYVFHPPMTVHGFKSAVPQDSVFLGRVSGALSVSYIDEPPQDDFYLADGSQPARVPVAYGDAPLELGWTSTSFLGSPAEVCVLSVDPDTGEGSAFIRLPAGWQSREIMFEHELELFVRHGGIAIGDGDPGPVHAYFCYPPKAEISPLKVVGETVIYVNFGGPLT